ncbi:hypothetical protein ACPYO6_04130 [Georgenia sp. Z1344]|uniref:hypothetical protein n=1 Tax=Georgenia sp. Z1344 TaxID=3416706 RepID=UPI003CFB6F2B
MTTTAEPRVHATVVLGPVVRDVAVPDGATVADVLRRLRVDARSRSVLVTDSSGWRVAADDVIGIDVPDGVLLTVTRGSAGASIESDELGRARVLPAGADSFAVAGAGLVLVVGGVLLLAGTAWWGMTDPLPAWWRGTVVALLALAALGLALRRGREGVVLLDIAALSLVSVAAGVLVVPADGPAQLRLALVVAPAVAGAALALRAGAAERRRDRTASAAALVATVWLGAAIAALATLEIDTGMSVVGALVVGAVPPLLLAMPDLAIDVPDDQLLDLEHVSRDATGVRQAAPKAPAEVTAPRVRRVVTTARLRQDLVVVLMSLLAAMLAPSVLAIVPVGGIRGWAALVTVVLLVLALLLVPRGARARTVRVLPRVAAFVVIGQIAWAAVVGGRAEALTVGIVAVVAALVIAGLAIAVARGLSNVALARLGDIVQGFATHLALPAGAVAAGAIHWVRQVGL